MAKSEKTYYFLKLEKDFFDKKEIRLLRKVAGGDTYTIIYLKMLLMALSDEGVFYFENIGENIAEEVALTIDEDVENVSVTLTFLQKKGLLEIVETDKYYLNSTPEMVGKLTSNALRQRKFRDRKNQEALQNNTHVTQNNVEIELEKEIELEVEVEKEKTPTTPPPFNQDFVNLYQVFEAETGKALSPLQIEELKYMLEDFSPDLIHEALKEAVNQSKANFAYIKAILSRWKSDNLLTVELVKNDKAVRETKKLKSKSQMTQEEWRQSLKEPDPEYGF